MECAIQYEIALINQDHNLLHRVVDNFVDRLRHSTVFQGGHHHDVTTINNKTTFCEHNAGVFHYNVSSYRTNYCISKCVSRLCATLYDTSSLRVNMYVSFWKANQLYLS